MADVASFWSYFDNWVHEQALEQQRLKLPAGECADPPRVAMRILSFKLCSFCCKDQEACSCMRSSLVENDTEMDLCLSKSSDRHLDRFMLTFANYCRC